jgi:hypothetical protein
VEEQRLERERRRNDEAKRSSDAERKAAADAAAKSAADSSSTAAAEDGGADGDSAAAASAASAAVFTTELRPGESFRSFQARLVREKSERMQMEVKRKTLSDKRKRKLDERDEKKKTKKDPTLDTREQHFLEERQAKDAADAARAALLKAGPMAVGAKGKAAVVAAAAAAAASACAVGASDDDDDNGRPSKRARTVTATEFASTAVPVFGDVVDRPPSLTVLPKSKGLPSAVDTERMLSSLLLLQEGKSAKRGGLKGLDATARADWIAAQRARLQRESAAEEQQRAALDELRAQSVAAYKAAKLKRKQSDAEAKESGEGGREQPYVKRNRDATEKGCSHSRNNRNSNSTCKSDAEDAATSEKRCLHPFFFLPHPCIV